MKKQTVILTIILILLLGGCSEGRLGQITDQFSFPTESATSAPAEARATADLSAVASATATQQPDATAAEPAAADAAGQAGAETDGPPTAEPTPSPSPTASPLPTPTPPSPEAILDLALYLMDSAESYHFAFTTQTTNGNGEPATLTFDGVYAAPHTISGAATLALDAEPVESTIICYDKQYYESPDGQGSWRYYPVEAGHLARADLDQLWGGAPHAAPPFESLTYEGIEESDGKPAYHLRGTLPGSYKAPSVQGDISVDMLIGVEDGTLHRYDVTFTNRLPHEDEAVEVQESYRYREVNEPIAIDIPDVTIAALAYEEPALGLAYKAPGDWTIESTGEGCAAGSCPAVTLYRDRPAGPHSTVTLALLAPEERPFLEEVMTPPAYEETELGGMPARLRTGEEFVDGLIYPDAEHALQLSARWEGHPEEEAAVWQILDSLESTIPSAPQGFVRHTLPGWGSIDIPEGWHFVNPPSSDQMVFSSADVDFTYDAGPEDALVIVAQLLDIYAMPLTFLQDEYLPSIDYDWEAVEGPQSVTVGEYRAATVTYHGYEDWMDMVTAVGTQDGRFIIFYATAGEEAWSAYEPLFVAMRNSLQLSPVADPPQLDPLAEQPEGTIQMRDEEQGFLFAYPETWQFSQEKEDDVVSNYLLVPPDIAEDEIGLVKVYPPSTIIYGEDSTEDQPTALGQLDALANWSGDLTIRDALRTSWTSTYRTPFSEYAASTYVATKEGRPIYGFMGAMTDGDLAVKLIAWFEDPDTYRETVLAIFNSIQLTAPPDLQRDTAEPLQPGARFDGQISSREDQFFSFEATSGQTYLLFSQMNAAELEDVTALLQGVTEFDLSVFDPQGSAMAFQPAISYFNSGMSVFEAEESGQYIVAVRPFDFVDAGSFILYLLPVGEGEPGTVEMTKGALAAEAMSCMSYLYLDPEGERFVIYAAPLGRQADETTLSLAAMDGAGNTLYQCGEYCAQEGQPTSFVISEIGDKGFSVRVCELNDQEAEFELIVLALPE